MSLLHHCSAVLNRGSEKWEMDQSPSWVWTGLEAIWTAASAVAVARGSDSSKQANTQTQSLNHQTHLRTKGWEEATIPCRPSTGLRREAKGILPSSRHMVVAAVVLGLLLLLLRQCRCK